MNGLGEFLRRPIAGMPAWVWLIVVVGGGVAVAIFIRRQGSSNSQSGTLGSNPGGQQAPGDYSQIDPYTGVPYTIESQINPNTGLPAYYGGPGVDNNNAGSQISGPPAPPSGTPPPPPPSGTPPTPPVPGVTTGATSAGSVLPGGSGGRGRMPPVAPPPGSHGGPIPPTGVPGGHGRPIPPIGVGGAAAMEQQPTAYWPIPYDILAAQNGRY